MDEAHPDAALVYFGVQILILQCAIRVAEYDALVKRGAANSEVAERILRDTERLAERLKEFQLRFELFQTQQPCDTPVTIPGRRFDPPS